MHGRSLSVYGVGVGMGRSGAGASGEGSCVGCDLSIQAMLRMMATKTATKRVPTMRERMAIWDTFLLFECGTAIENGRVKTEASSFFSDHQRWLAAFLLAFPEVAVVPQSNETDAPLALISTSGSPQCGRSKDRALLWLSRSLRPVTGRNCYSRLLRRSARKLAKKSVAERRTKRIAALALLPRSTADHIILSDAAWPHRERSPPRWTHSRT